jgi:hypothetical protein
MSRIFRRKASALAVSCALALGSLHIVALALTYADGPTAVAYLTATTAASSAYLTAMSAANAAYATAAGAAVAAFHTAVAPEARDALPSAADRVYAAQYADALHAAVVSQSVAWRAAALACNSAMSSALNAYTVAPTLLEREAQTTMACPPSPGLPSESEGAAHMQAGEHTLQARERAAPVSAAYRWAGAQVERAYLRRHALLDEQGRQPLALTSKTGLFPAFGFAPPASLGEWSLQGIDDNQTLYCVNTEVSSLYEWKTLIVNLSENKMRPAAPDCSAAATYLLPPEFPGAVASRKVLDRRDSILPTVVHSYPEIVGIPALSALPAMVLRSHPGWTSESVFITLVNTPRGDPAGPPGALLTTGVSSMEISSGFRAQHSCTAIVPNAACAVEVWHEGGEPMTQQVGQLRIEFATGGFSTISLVGLVGP